MARLTAWEAGWRGFRLPHAVIVRGLDYHTASYLPVSYMVLTTVIGYVCATAEGILDGSTSEYYLYVLSVEVVIAAGYLFWTYGLAMRNMIYANG